MRWIFSRPGRPRSPRQRRRAFPRAGFPQSRLGHADVSRFATARATACGRPCAEQAPRHARNLFELRRGEQPRDRNVVGMTPGQSPHEPSASGYAQRHYEAPSTSDDAQSRRVRRIWSGQDDFLLGIDFTSPNSSARRCTAAAYRRSMRVKAISANTASNHRRRRGRRDRRCGSAPGTIALRDPAALRAPLYRSADGPGLPGRLPKCCGKLATRSADRPRFGSFGECVAFLHGVSASEAKRSSLPAVGKVGRALESPTSPDLSAPGGGEEQQRG